jgi:hypothetical protein
MRIRSITVFTELSPTLEAAPLQQAGEFANAARQAYQAAGFDVQTTRLATHVLPHWQPRRSGPLSPPPLLQHLRQPAATTASSTSP